MNPNQLSTTDGGRYGESTRAVDDERCLYGEPCHESGTGADEQSLYGKPQHESTGDAADARDVELLFVRMQGDAIPPKSLGLEESSPVETTE